jgi:hypothetical protein
VPLDEPAQLIVDIIDVVHGFDLLADDHLFTTTAPVP